MALIVMSLVCIGLCYKWGKWKNWKIYYSTILFYIIGMLTAEIITDDKPLWLIKYSFWNNTLADYFIGYFIFPCIIILFLSNFPKHKIRQIAYIFIFVFVLSSVEYVAHIRKAISYHNGWTFVWSILLYIGMFPLLQLHYKKPLLAWLIFFTMVMIGSFYFKISLIALK